MNKLVRCGKFAFVGFIIGYILTFLLGTWTWLDMRGNIAIIIPGAVLLGIIVSLWNKYLVSKGWFFISEIIVCFIFLIIYWNRLDAIMVIPGIIFKEAFHLSFIRLEVANLLLVSVLIIGNLIWLMHNKYEENNSR